MKTINARPMSFLSKRTPRNEDLQKNSLDVITEKSLEETSFKEKNKSYGGHSFQSAKSEMTKKEADLK
jgi:hypothetical protein